MARRPCLDCHRITDGTRCTECTRKRDKARGTRQARGYDADHDKLRARWQRRLDAGEVVHCWRCRLRGVLTPIDPEHWHLGHDDQDRAVYRGPECPPCNLATSARPGVGATPSHPTS